MSTANRSTPARDVFHIERDLEFFSEDELAKQIGHDPENWPSALLAELISNGLDAAEAAGAAPDIAVEIQRGEDGDTFAVTDNGGGIPWEVVVSSLDYTTRTTDKAFYRSPTRGRQGNALKTVWAAPCVVASGAPGVVTVEAHGQKRTVEVSIDQIALKPCVSLTEPVLSDVKNGSKFTVGWPEEACSLNDPDGSVFYKDEPIYSTEIEFGLTAASMLVRSFALFNPHASFTLVPPDQDAIAFAVRKAAWKKWSPDEHPVHWYALETFRDLMAACLREDRARQRVRSVREFVAGFRGLSGSAKPRAVCKAAGVGTGETIEDIVGDAPRLRKLLAAMKAESKAPEPKQLGVIGKDAMTAGMLSIFGCNRDTVKYQSATGYDSDDVPWVVEVAFGQQRQTPGAVVTVGLNWAPSLRVPFDSLTNAIQDARIDGGDPVALAVHVAYPAACALDRGKTRYDLPDELAGAMAKAVAGVTKVWTKAKDKAAARRSREVKPEDLEKQAEKRVRAIVKRTAYEFMPKCYALVSGRAGVAPARMMMYTARDHIINKTGIAKPWKHSQYFTQKLLPDYMAEHAEETANWKVVFDDRGHCAEPHTDKSIGIGTLSVRRYTLSWSDPPPSSEVGSLKLDTLYPTSGPKNRFKFVLFIEKEGFNELLSEARIEERFDLALMSTKGMSVTAARKLIESFTERDVTTLVLHDFDASGVGIRHWLSNSNRRYTFETDPQVIDLGLRLEDVKRLQLPSEACEYTQKKDPRIKLREYGATEDECDYLVERYEQKQWHGKRVELNALQTADRFIEFLEEKFAAHGVTKLVPDAETLDAAFVRGARIARAQAALDRAVQEANREIFTAPADLQERVTALLRDEPDIPWDDAVYRVARELSGGEE